MKQPKVATKNFSVTGTTSVTKLIEENLNRKELIVTNASSAVLYLSFGGLPTTTNYSVAVPANGGVFFTDSTDRVNGVWASAAGQANVVERL